MPLALKISQQQEQAQKIQGPSCPLSLLQAPQMWEVMGWFFSLGTRMRAAGRAVRLDG